MLVLTRRFLALCLILASFSTVAFAEWQPTPDELSMKSYAADPDAPAVYLYREETVDDLLHIHTVSARVKILSEKGKQEFADIEIPYLASGYKIRGISGRTIHSDGTVVPFTGKPYDKLLLKQGNLRVMAKVFSMPDVQVGSIVEYQWVLEYGDGTVSSPDWQIQQSIPVLNAHYHFTPSKAIGDSNFTITERENGHDNVANVLLYSYILPTGEKVTTDMHGYDLKVENIPAIPHGDYLPPTHSLYYRLTFYYSPFHTSAEYWTTEGKYWSKNFDHFADQSGKLRDAVKGIIAPGDTDEQKVTKIYAAMMKIDDTDFSRQHTAAENKAEGVKIKNAEDVWTEQRGTGDEITRLFVAMVRAAGLKAYGAIVVDRDRDIFNQNYLSWDQLDDELAIVTIDGKEVYFDPGQRYCEFAKLAWKHTWAGGIRQSDKGPEIFSSPAPAYTDNSVSRIARLTLSPDGHLTGLIYETMNGAQALRWRQAALRGDEAGVKKQFEDDLQHSMPPGVQVKLNHFVGITDFTHPLMAIVNASGTLGTATGKHLFLPAVFFEAGDPPLFAETHREDPVYMHYPYMVKDDFQVMLPDNMTVESLPKGGDIPFSPNADYLIQYGSGPHTFAYGRLFRSANIIYKPTGYSALHAFFQKVSASDQEQIAMKISPVTIPAATAATAMPANAPAGK